MKLVMKWFDDLWNVAAKMVLPDRVFQFENLDMPAEDADRVYLQEQAERCQEHRVRATCSNIESFNDMAALFKDGQQKNLRLQSDDNMLPSSHSKENL